ncbi:MAG: hypothetical protein HYV63_26820 [Candidatus Schekmanbacteria bacterium]|nr:hypothetical protein [Candidatus Schekmanbacteria bacterium]
MDFWRLSRIGLSLCDVILSQGGTPPRETPTHEKGTKGGIRDALSAQLAVWQAVDSGFRPSLIA